MSKEVKVNQATPQEIPSQERYPEVNIEKSGDSGWAGRYDRPNPLSWQPTIDQTGSTPPDGGSGSGESE